LIVYAVVDDALSPDFPLGDSLEVFIRREDAERFVDEVCDDEARGVAFPVCEGRHHAREREEARSAAG
jgi:hypothetical protein